MLATLEKPSSAPAGGIDFELPPSLEAREPPEAQGLARDEVRLLVSRCADDETIDARFREIARFLDTGDLLVVNDSATIPAALTGTRENGEQLAVHLSTRLAEDLWVIEPRKTAARAGERLRLPQAESVRLLEPYRDSARLWVARLELGRPVLDYLRDWGQPIKYPYVAEDWPIETYQTVFARRPGSAEMPSAGRAFSRRIIKSLPRKGVSIAAVTLHTGVSSLEGHERPYPEWFEVSAAAAQAVNGARHAGRQVIAVGTTVVRALESAAGEDGTVRPASGWTDLVVTPERGVRVVNGILTGFHEPRASHLAMLEAIAGRRCLEEAYSAALRGGYLWHEFGDLHLIR